MTSNATTRFSQKLVILTFCITNEIIIITVLHSALLFCLLLLKLYCYIIDRGNILEHSRFFFYLSPTSQRAALLLFPCITNENVFFWIQYSLSIYLRFLFPDLTKSQDGPFYQLHFRFQTHGSVVSIQDQLQKFLYKQNFRIETFKLKYILI